MSEKKDLLWVDRGIKFKKGSVIKEDDKGNLYYKNSDEYERHYLNDLSNFIHNRCKHFNISIGDVISLPAGSKPFVILTGPNCDPVLNFGLVQGNTGATGS